MERGRGVGGGREEEGDLGILGRGREGGGWNWKTANRC